MTKILITGAAGFIGHHVVEHLLKNTDWQLELVDKLSYSSSGMDRLHDIQAFDEKRCRMFTTDISQPIPVGLEREIGHVDYILHMAAETHVDNSISDPRPFVFSNVMGTFEMLQFARRLKSNLKKFIYFSTDEVFGPAPAGVEFKDWDRFNPTNPYSATKAAGEDLCLAWANTYKLPILITHCMNVFGERQHPEKFLPLIVKKLMQDDLITVHASASGKPGSRFYIHARNVAAAILFLLKQETLVGDKFNITGEQEVSNLDLVMQVRKVLFEFAIFCNPKVLTVPYDVNRPGHDLRYALDGSKLKSLGWEPPKTFEDSLRKTVEWMISPRNLKWLMMTKESVYA